MFKDKQLGKKTSFSFPRPFEGNPKNISGIFSYGGKEGLIWNDLVPENVGEKPTYNSFEEALEAYNSKEYFVLNKEQKKNLEREKSYGTRSRNGMILLAKNEVTSSYMEKYQFIQKVVSLSL